MQFVNNKHVHWLHDRAQQNQQQSPLLRLPAELRNKIFAYTLGGKTFKIIPGYYDIPTMNATNSKYALALLQVCRQIYAETTLLPFSINTFSASSPHSLKRWVERLHPARAQSITWIRLKFRREVCDGSYLSPSMLQLGVQLSTSGISNRGHVAISMSLPDIASEVSKEQQREIILKMFQEENRGVNFVLE